MNGTKASLLGNSLRIGVLCGMLAGLVCAAWMSWQDWRLNPGEIFRSAAGTHWDIVMATAWSWFWPVGVAGIAVVTPIAMLMTRNTPKRH